MEIEGIDSEIFVQYEKIRESGLTNMFDRNRVLQIAEQIGFDELTEFIEEDNANYGKILRNYGKAKDAKII
jgi:hypothetical protein